LVGEYDPGAQSVQVDPAMCCPTAQLWQVLPAPLETEPRGHCWHSDRRGTASWKKVCFPQQTGCPNAEQWRKVSLAQLRTRGHWLTVLPGTYTLDPGGGGASVAGIAVDRLVPATRKEYPGCGSALDLTIAMKYPTFAVHWPAPAKEYEFAGQAVHSSVKRPVPALYFPAGHWEQRFEYPAPPPPLPWT
jgi:hypothetical protein